ncbi:helix-turn-helix domain-containing protein [Streptomyces sp. 4.24]|uniref:helix-turn-helix domain-containing protein n=1 Tax=Streptomyces tritrimontium TaxID=3406573 RepID=UPI003BB4C472
MTVPGFRAVGSSPVKRAFTFRVHPTDAQAREPSRTFGCARKAYNPALAARADAWTSRTPSGSACGADGRRSRGTLPAGGPR